MIFSYIVWGALLFGRWEDWNYLDGSYFCFISLSSIGFGDLVPGERVVSHKVWENFEKKKWKPLPFKLFSIDNCWQRQGWAKFYSLRGLSTFGYGTNSYVFQFDASSCYNYNILYKNYRDNYILYYFRSKLYIICVLLKRQ